MACNFNMQHHIKDGNLSITLSGDFDGASACEVLNLLEQYRKEIRKVIIHTDGLKSVHPFGKAVFEQHFPALNGRFDRVVFTGGKRIRFT